MAHDTPCACRHIGLRRRQPQSLGLQRRTQSIGLSYMPTIIVGGGGCKAVEQYLLIPSAIGLETITPSDIAAKWRSIYANPAIVPSHSSQPLLTIQTDKQDSALEQQYNIADTIQVVTMSSQEIKQKFNDIYQTLR